MSMYFKSELISIKNIFFYFSIIIVTHVERIASLPVTIVTQFITSLGKFTRLGFVLPGWRARYMSLIRYKWTVNF